MGTLGLSEGWGLGDDRGVKSTVSQFQVMGRKPGVQLVSPIVIKTIFDGGGTVVSPGQSG